MRGGTENTPSRSDTDMVSFHPRGGSTTPSRNLTSTATHDSKQQQPQYETLSKPAPGSPFHYAFPVHDLNAAKEFYGAVLGCKEGRSSEKWQDYSLHGHQIVCHWAGDDYRCQDYYNPVDGDDVPVPHMGLALTVDQFHELASRLKDQGITFIIEPTLRFEGQPGEQWTMFFKDPSGNNLECKYIVCSSIHVYVHMISRFAFCLHWMLIMSQTQISYVVLLHINLFPRTLVKAMTHHDNLFAKYNVPP